MNSVKAVGVDVGGTKIFAALADGDGRILNECRLKTPKTEKEILIALAKAIRKAKGSEKIEGIGVGFAGFVESEKGTVISSPNMPAIKGTKVKAFLEKRFKCRIALENDANMFALGEYFFGFGGKFKNVVALTIGTGIGSGVIEKGRLLKGKGIAAEFGHTIIDAGSAEKCFCGNQGCFEALACGRALVKRANALGLKAKSAEEVAKKAKAGNKAAIVAIKETARFLGTGMANAANAFDPDIIVLGGGLSNIPLLLKEAEKEMEKHVVVKKRVKVFREKLHGKGAVLGAALCALDSFLLSDKRPMLTADCIVEYKGGIVFVERRYEPKGWALPGGIVEYNESLESAVKREVFEETGLRLAGLKQFRAYSEPGRDPRWHSATVVFTAKGLGRIRQSHESRQVKVFRLRRMPRLVFDHKKILKEWAKQFYK
ncbi:MAG: ROK family protein [Candidatus Diapherotrites archaeon]|nr:ROK family protein [Candidatus Diapherotrites archaeon]